MMADQGGWLTCLLNRAAREWPGATAVIDPHCGPLSFTELDQRVSLRARDLRAQGLCDGDWLMLAARNDLAGLVDLLAVLRAGGLILPVNPALPVMTRSGLAARHGISAWIPAPGEDILFDAPSGISPPACRPAGAGSSPVGADAGDLHRVFPAQGIFGSVLTSGSLGEPKLAVHSHANHRFSAAGAHELMPLQPGDRYLWSLPSYHVGGLAIVFRCLLGGATLVLGGRADDPAFIRSQGVTHLSMVETQLLRLLRHPDPLPPLKLLLGGGAVRADCLARAGERGLVCWLSYGLTEMCAQVITHDPDGRAHLLAHRECRLSETGEILVRGDTLFLGYLDAGRIRPAVDAGCWFHTGDLGRWADGRFEVCGRMDNRFISGGENIQPEAIEAALLHCPGILQAVVVPVPDAEFGQRPVAFLACENGQDFDVAVIQDCLRQRLPGFMLPRAFLAMPAHEGLKPRRADLRALAVQTLRPAGMPGPDH